MEDGAHELLAPKSFVMAAWQAKEPSRCRYRRKIQTGPMPMET